MKSLYILISFIVASQLSLFGADSQKEETHAGDNGAKPSPVMVCEVTFSQGTIVQNDDGSPMGGKLPAGVETNPHWVDMVNNEHPSIKFPDGKPDNDAGGSGPNKVKSYAYSYVSNKAAKVGAKFEWRKPKGTPPVATEQRYAVGTAKGTNCSFKLPRMPLTDNTDYPGTVAVEDPVTQKGANVTEKNNRRIQAHVTLNRKVVRSDGKTDLAAGLGPLTIKWTVYDSLTKSDPVNVVGTSESTHTIYVTWDEPTTKLRQETLFNLACETADGLVGGDVTKKNHRRCQFF